MGFDNGFKPFAKAVLIAGLGGLSGASESVCWDSSCGARVLVGMIAVLGSLLMVLSWRGECDGV
jgi:hypothetical protein